MTLGYETHDDKACRDFERLQAWTLYNKRRCYIYLIFRSGYYLSQATHKFPAQPLYTEEANFNSKIILINYLKVLFHIPDVLKL